jgi:hypothetical protein
MIAVSFSTGNSCPAGLLTTTDNPAYTYSEEVIVIILFWC